MAQLLTNLTDNPNQRFEFELPDGTSFEMDLQYRVQQRGWFFNLRYQDDFIVNGIRIALASNLLNQFENIIPFGMAVVSNDGIEPVNQTDFSSGRVQIGILTEAEVEELNDFLNSQKSGAGEV